MKLADFRERHDSTKAEPEPRQEAPDEWDAEPVQAERPSVFDAIARRRTKPKAKVGPTAEEDLAKLARVRTPGGPRILPRHYAITDTGPRGVDAEIKFGKHNGSTVSDVALVDPSYLIWILSQEGFPEEFLDVVRRYA